RSLTRLNVVRHLIFSIAVFSLFCRLFRNIPQTQPPGVGVRGLSGFILIPSRDSSVSLEMTKKASVLTRKQDWNDKRGERCFYHLRNCSGNGQFAQSEASRRQKSS